MCTGGKELRRRESVKIKEKERRKGRERKRKRGERERWQGVYGIGVEISGGVDSMSRSREKEE